jgi:hypothetical protein
LSLTPPDLGKPYSTEADRADAREALLLYWVAIESLIKLAKQPASQWSDQQKSLFPSPSAQGGPPEPPDRRLQRWLDIYSDEINLVRDVRSRLVHGGMLVTDPELRGAVYLARHVVSSAMGVLPSQAEPVWARNTLAQAAAS